LLQLQRDPDRLFLPSLCLPISSPPGYKLPESVPGAGESGISGQNTNQEALANGGRQPQTLNEEVGQTLPSNFTLANTKAESKGEDHL
jgi:hypothetical protein